MDAQTTIDSTVASANDEKMTGKTELGCTYSSSACNLSNKENHVKLETETEPVVVHVSGDETEEELQANKRMADLALKYKHRLNKQVIYKGMLLNSVKTVAGMESLPSVELRDGDVVICGYPKSGTTWLQEVVWLVMNKADIAAANASPTYCRIQWFDDLRSHKKIPTMDGPRTFKSHLHLSRFPPSVHSQDVKMIYIARNPKDVAVSYYYYYQSLVALGSYKGGWDEFLAMFLDGYISCEDWFDHVNSWWQEKNANQKILFVTYEEMKADIKAMISMIADFCKITLSDKQVEAIIQHTTFQAMKDNPSTNLAGIKSIALPFMRKGGSGDWKNHFSDEQAKQFDEVIRQKITDDHLRHRIGFLN